MWDALFRLEACEADAAIDALTFLPEDPQTPQFRFKHAAVSTVQDAFPSTFRFYSRYVFLHVFTALQVLLGIFTLYMFNYMGTIRYHYAPRFIVLRNETLTFSTPSHEEKGQLQEVRNPRGALGTVYLTIASFGMFFVIFVTLYILVTNSDWCVSMEMRRWASDQESSSRRDGMCDAMSAFEPEGSTFPGPNRGHHDYYGDRTQQQDCPDASSGSRLRRLGVRWVSYTRPYYAFPASYLSDFDYRHDLHVKYGSHASRRDPKRIIFYMAAPFVFVLTILDIITVDDMRELKVKITLLQGLLLGCGPLFLLYVLQSIMVVGMTHGKTFARDITNFISA